LRHRAYRALTQRIGAQFHLEPLDEEDSVAYVRHRLEVAGGRADLFTRGAVRVLHRAAGGLPRVINHLATQALLEGLARGASVIDEDVATAAAAGQFLPGLEEEAGRARARH
jgi:type II secretory pathway predicted ATPase ExeA